METTKLSDSCCCRLCAEENKNGTHLFSTAENSENLSELVNKYLPLKVENDHKFPSTICPGCHIQLEATKSFMDLIVDGQAKLRDLYRNQQEILFRQEKQRQQLQEVLQSVNPNTTVKTYTIESDESGVLQSFIQIFSDGPLFPPDHELALRTGGLDKPKRRRGRPPKQVRELKEQETATEKQTSEEEVRHEEEDDCDVDGRRRRKIKPPVKYDGVIQGEELEKMLKDEGIIKEDVSDDINSSSQEDQIIGRLQSGNGEDLGEPVYINRSRVKVKLKVGSKKKTTYRCSYCRRQFFHFGRFQIHMNTHKIIYICQEVNCNFKCKEKSVSEAHQKELGHTMMMKIDEINSDNDNLCEITVLASKEPSVDFINSEQSPPAQQVSNVSDQSLLVPVPDISDQNTDDQSLPVQQVSNMNDLGSEGKEKPYVCEQCNKSFLHLYSLRIHKAVRRCSSSSSDAVPKQYVCDVCDKGVNHPSSLLYHKETKHSDGKRYACIKCDKTFKLRQQLHRHQMVHTEDRPYVCQKCNAPFKTQSNLTNHQLVHTREKKFCCNMCGQKFAHKTSLTLHKRWHDGEKPFQCEICLKTFTQKGNLIEHKRIHTGEKPYCCDQCGKSFTTSSQFNLHMKRHTGEKPWVCDYCSKSFLHKDTFKIHVRRHLNERPFKCRICNRSFPESWALKRHYRIHTKERPYACEFCGKTFADSSNKNKHMRTHPNVLLLRGPISQRLLPGSENSVNQNDQHEYFQVLDPPFTPKTEMKDEEASNGLNMQLTQLFDPQGNPISITTADGQTIPVVTDGDENSIKGLLPDGTLVPINLVKNMAEDDASLGQQPDMFSMQVGVEKHPSIIESGDHTLDNANIQLITGEDGQEMCLITYGAISNNSAVINQEMDSALFLGPA